MWPDAFTLDFTSSPTATLSPLLSHADPHADPAELLSFWWTQVCVKGVDKVETTLFCLRARFVLVVALWGEGAEPGGRTQAPQRSHSEGPVWDVDIRTRWLHVEAFPHKAHRAHHPNQ